MLKSPAIRFVFLLLSGWLAVSQGLFAAPGEWTRLGPDRAPVYGLAIDANDNSIMYAGSSRGIYKTTDAGASWRYIEFNLHSLTFPDTIVIDPANSNRLIRSSRNGVTLSTDAGETWAYLDNTPAPLSFMAVAPADANRIYVARNDTAADKVHVSTDGGINWSPASNGLPAGERIRSFVMDPTNALHLYASLTVADSQDTNQKTIYYSTDGGANWNPAVTGPFWFPNQGPTPENITLQKLVASPVDGNLVYGINGYDLFRSNDGGLNWTRVFRDQDYTFRELFFDPTDGNRLVGQIFDERTATDIIRETTTTNDGVWTTISVGYLPRIDQLGQRNDQLVATTDTGFFTSDDDGASWSISSNGLDRGTVAAPIVHPDIEGRLYASAGGILRSDDGGQSWSQLGEARVGSLLIDPSNPDIIYSLEGIGVQRSIDGGHSWTRLSSPSSSTTDMAINADNGDELFFINSGKVVRSDDGGATTESLLDGDNKFETIRFDPLDTDVVYATRYNSAENRIDVFRSIDGGDSWSGLTELPTPHSSDVDPIAASIAYDHVINPQNTMEMYLSTNGGVYKSVNGGVDWMLSDTFRGQGDLEIDPIDSQRIYSPTSIGIIRTTTDGGATWNDFEATADFTIPGFFGFRISPHNPARMYAGSGAGILVTGPDFVPIDYAGVTASALKSLKKLEKKRSIRNDRKSKKFAKKARKHLELALNLFKDGEIISGRKQVENAIADLKKIRKAKRKVKKLIKQLKRIL